MSIAPKTLRLSVVIPTLNEAENLGTTLKPLRNGPDLEVIVVDGGSSDATVEVAEQYGAMVIVSPPGRGCQQNAGAAIAAGEILLFLHADTRLPDDFVELARTCLAGECIVGGAFSLSFDIKGMGIKFIEKAANIRSRFFQLPYGDQALFMSKENFEKIGGFPEIAIMEDFALVGRLRKLGRIKTLAAKAITSGRRWQELGILRTTLINQVMVIGYLLGLSPTSLANWYRISSKAR